MRSSRLSRLRSSVLAAPLLVAACSSGGSTSSPTSLPSSTTAEATTSSTPTSSTSPAPPANQAIQTFDDTCLGVGPAPDDPAITFVLGGRLYSSVPGSDAAVCLLGSGSEPQWGPAADRFLSGDMVFMADGKSEALVAGLAGTRSFTRPTGASVIAVDGAGRLVKTNIGTGVERLLAETSGVAISHLSVADDGGSLVFVADHGGETHVHRSLLAGDDLVDSEQQAEILIETTGTVRLLVVDRLGTAAAAERELLGFRLIARTALGRGQPRTSYSLLIDRPISSA